MIAVSLEQLVDRFEDAWERGERPDIDAHLPDGDDRLLVLIELVHIDLERRLKLGEPVRIETYLQRYPELAEAAILTELATAEYEMRRRNDPTLTVDEYSGRFPQLGIVFPAPTVSVAPGSNDAISATLAMGTPANGPAGTHAGPIATNASYLMLRPHAQGGLGEVFVARDGVLNREVALKFLRPGRVRDRESRSRFLREAEITGRLEHPGVVPVYGLGRDAAGNPVYAMRFIRGQTLQEAIDRYHATAPRLRSGPRRLAFQNLLGRFVSVCNTIAYAHTRGIIHRDLKPGNILLGEFGETIVVDWGLAKEIADCRSPIADLSNCPVKGADDREDNQTNLSDLKSAIGHRQSAIDATVAGEVIGTPAFMSPEQARGELGGAGPSSDIYSLGAVLYALLTGRAPFQQASVPETLEKVRRGEFDPPRKVNWRTPQALEAVCLKAMATDPGRRYGSALELAGDMERFMAGEPVSAWREPMAVKARRWLSRHTTLVTGGSVALIAAALLTGVTAIWHAERSDRRLAEFQREQDRKELDRRDQDQYLHRVTQAGRAWLKGDREGTLRHLQQCKPELREWEWHHLHRCANLEPRVLKGHTNEAWAVAYSRDGTRLASAGLDGVVNVWDTATGEKVLTLPANKQPVWAVAFHPDGNRLATGGDDSIVHFWDLRTGKEVATFEMQVEVGDIAFSRDGKLLAVSTMPGRRDRNNRHIGPGHVALWDLATGDKLGGTFSGHSSGIHSIAFAPDGRLATGGLDGIVKVWDPIERKLLHIPQARGASVYKVAFNPDGSLLAWASGDWTISVWEVKAAKLKHRLFGHQKTVWGVAFSPDGLRLASSSDDFTIKIWDPLRGRLLYTLRGHSRGIANVAIRPDGAQIASASDDQSVRLWPAGDPGTTTALIEHTDRVRSVAVRHDGRFAASASDDRTVRLWDLVTHAEMACLREPDKLTCVAFERSGPLLAYSGIDGVVRLWDSDKQQVVRTWPAHQVAIHCLAFSPDGTYLATASADNSVKLWRVADGGLERTLTGHRDQVWQVAFGPDGRSVATASADKTARIWDVATGKPRHTLAGATSAVLCVAFSPDGTTLAAGTDRTDRVLTGESGQVKLWNAETGEELTPLQGHFGGVTSVTFSADGKRLVSGGDDGTLKIWDRASGQDLLTLHGHVNPSRPVAVCVAVSADGRLIISGGHDGNVLLWHGPR